MTRQPIGVVLFALLMSWATSAFAQGAPRFSQSAAPDPYTTSLGLRYDFLSHAPDETSALGFNADLTRMLSGFEKGGGWGVGASLDFEKFEGVLLKQFEAYVVAQGKATGQKEMSPFGRFGIGFNSAEGSTDGLLDFRGGVDFKWKPDAQFLISTMISIKRVLVGEGRGYNVTRLSAGIVLPLDK